MTKPGLLLAERFWPKVKKHKSGCWVWTACTIRGYGAMHLRLDEHPRQIRMVPAHQISWFLYTGKWTKKNILHTCDNPPCVRPSHLYEGTNLDNVRDRDTRGRTRKGERHAYAVLTIAKVRVIRLSYLPDNIWAKKFGVSKAAIGKARRGESWSHIKNPSPVRRHK